MSPRSSFDPTQPEAPSFKQRVKGFARRHPLLYLLYNFQQLLKGQQIVFLDYPVTPQPRWGFGKPAHPQLAEVLGRDREAYRRTLASFLQFQEHLVKIPRTAAADSAEPCWVNKWLPPPDEAALYCFLGLNQPKRYVEVGSGQSAGVGRLVLLRAVPAGLRAARRQRGIRGGSAQRLRERGRGVKPGARATVAASDAGRGEGPGRPLLLAAHQIKKAARRPPFCSAKLRSVVRSLLANPWDPLRR